MITGVGVDIESVARFKKTCNDKHFLSLIFTKAEIAYCKRKKEPWISLAGKFCAKEAVFKAYKKKIPLKNIELVNTEKGAVKVKILGKLDKRIKCSISHSQVYAVAFVIIEC